MGYDKSFFTNRQVIDSVPGLTCPLCAKVVEQPLESPCGHVFCTPCISSHLSSRNSCPTCSKPVAGVHVLRPSVVMQTMLDGMATRCFSCPWQGPFAQLGLHGCQGGRAQPQRPAAPQQPFTPVAYSSSGSMSQAPSYRSSSPQLPQQQQQQPQQPQGYRQAFGQPAAYTPPAYSQPVQQQQQPMSYRQQTAQQQPAQQPVQVQLGAQKPILYSQAVQQVKPSTAQAGRLNFPVKADSYSAYSNQCKNCGGVGKSRDIGSDGYCSFCRKYG